MTFSDLCWLIIIIIGCMCICVSIGYQWGKEDTTDPRNWDRAPQTHPYPISDDETWQRIEAAWASDDETGHVDLPAPPERAEQGAEPDDAIPARDTVLLQPPGRHERLADTGELRALAYAGDIDAIMDQVAAFTTELERNDDA